MPIYQYKCVCGDTVELLMCISNTKTVRCRFPCGKKMERVIGPVHAVVKNPAVPKKVK